MFLVFVSHGILMLTFSQVYWLFLFYNALYGINYRLPNVTYIVTLGVYSVVCVFCPRSNHLQY